MCLCVCELERGRRGFCHISRVTTTTSKCTAEKGFLMEEVKAEEERKAEERSEKKNQTYLPATRERVPPPQPSAAASF